MTPNGWLQIAFFFAPVLLAAKPMGLYMARVYERRRRCWTRAGPGGAAALSHHRRQSRRRDALDRVWRGDADIQLRDAAADVCVERLQHAIPLWNPQHLAAVEPYLAWNTAALVHHQYQLAGVCARDRR